LNEAFSLVGLVGKTFRFACLDTPRKQRTYVGFVGGIDFEATSFGFGALAEELKCGFG